MWQSTVESGKKGSLFSRKSIQGDRKDYIKCIDKMWDENVACECIQGNFFVYLLFVFFPRIRKHPRIL